MTDTFGSDAIADLQLPDDRGAIKAEILVQPTIELRLTVEATITATQQTLPLA